MNIGMRKMAAIPTTIAIMMVPELIPSRLEVPEPKGEVDVPKLLLPSYKIDDPPPNGMFRNGTMKDSPNCWNQFIISILKNMIQSVVTRLSKFCHTSLFPNRHQLMKQTYDFCDWLLLKVWLQKKKTSFMLWFDKTPTQNLTYYYDIVHNWAIIIL